ncbi:ketopantoate reductase family protein [Thalassotalea profundi]|uniref:2-dehydropantoate 2-reductase n=1 Tax=Thalassotalea profundi TaxID=2036687 RepID=A0ABQ3IUC4_9GAMM|nr:2-dehydropantoate 2-reductase [Thalassotalea profundi]GHE94778.1 2-dehydropantoate 2-reductase [Thalassotalea profundi]
MNIVIVGQGPIGLMWYRYLALSTANNVKIVCSKNVQPPPSFFSFSNLNANPPDKLEQIKLVSADDDSITKADLIIVCVKSFQVISALKRLQNILNSKTIIALCHNGMGVKEQLPDTIKQAQTIVSFLITHGAKLNAPFDIVHTGLGKTDIGLVCGSLNSKKQAQLIKTIDNALPQTSWQDNIQQKQWEKLAINCVINPITAIHNIKNGDVNQEQYDQTKIQVLEEVITVAKAEGIELNHGSLLNIVDQVILLTAENSSSMRSDILAKRSTEIDYINGYIHQLGIKHLIPTPQNSLLWQQVKATELQDKK